MTFKMERNHPNHGTFEEATNEEHDPMTGQCSGQAKRPGPGAGAKEPFEPGYLRRRATEDWPQSEHKERRCEGQAHPGLQEEEAAPTATATTTAQWNPSEFLC